MNVHYLNDHLAGPQQRPAAPLGAPDAGGGPGLVIHKTSDTPDPNTIEIDPKEARLRRMRRSVNVAARLFDFFLGRRNFKPAMLTLTYRDVDGFEPKDVSSLIKCIREWLKRRGFRLHYVWVAELQQRGALHYHVLIWLPRGLTLPKPDKQGWWRHGSTRIEWARNPIGYLCKYVSKFDSQHELPKHARLHGAGGFEGVARSIRRWFNLPSWLKCLVGIDSAFVRVKGQGLVERGTGVCMQSPWRVSFSGGIARATRLFTHPEALRDTPGPWCALPAR